MRKILAFLTAAFLASSPLAQPANAWTDTVFPDSNDQFRTRIGNSSWVSVVQIPFCESGWVNDKCTAPVPNTGGVYSKANLVDPRGYNLPSIVIGCTALTGPVKYSLQVNDNAWFLDNDGQNIKVPNRIELNVDGRNALVVNGYPSTEFNEFRAEISQYQLLRIREARQVISEMSVGSPGVAFPAQGTTMERCSHWLYKTDLAATEDVAAIKFTDTQKPARTILEVRVGGGGKAAQTVFPGSVHPSGEAIEWEDQREVAAIDGDAGQILKGHPQNIRTAIQRLGVSLRLNEFSIQTEAAGVAGHGPWLNDAGAVRPL